jgi:hypothetical protein
MNYLIFVMVKCGVFFEVCAEFLNIILKSFSFKGLWISEKQDAWLNTGVNPLKPSGKYLSHLLDNL